MKIIHAVCDENGKAKGGRLGDQTGKEIREAKWYDKPFTQYIECLDSALADRAVTIIKAICTGNYGYSQDNRWTGYDSICLNGIENGKGDFDCSSLVLSVFRLAGLNIKEKSGSTRDAAKILTATGKFRLITEGEVLKNPELATKGSCYCTPAQHIVMCIENGSNSVHEDESEAVEVEIPLISHAEMVMAKGSVRIREKPKTGKTIAIAHKNDFLEIFGQDEETGWYKTATGYITNNERYVSRV